MKYDNIRRSIVLFAAVTVFVAMFAVPAFAVESKLEPVNLMLTDQITYSGNGAASAIYSNFVVPVYTNFFTWYSTNAGYSVDYISIFITSDSWIANSTLIVNDGVEITGTLAGFYDGQFQFNYPVDMIIQKLQLKIVLTDPGEYLSLNSVTGYFDSLQSPASVAAYAYGHFRDQSTATNNYNYRSTLVDRTAIDFPWNHTSLNTDFGADVTGITWLYNVYYFDIQSSSLAYSFYDKLIVQFVTSSSNVVGDLAVYPQGGSNIVDTVPGTLVESLEFYPVSGVYINGVYVRNADILYFNKVEFDVSNIDLSLYTLNFNFVLEPKPTGRQGTINTEQSGSYTYLNMVGMYFTENIVQLPWYQVFWNWLSGGLTNLGDRIVAAIKGLTISGTTEPSNDPMEQPADELSTQASEFNDAVDIIESVTKPSVDFDGLIDDVITPDPIAINAMNIVTGNDWAITALIIVVTLGICGFIFFGKR